MENLSTQQWDVIVVGGGPAGLAAALAARENGAAQVLLLERQNDLGGILNQCIHNGFGLHHFKEELTGPEYAERFIAQLPGSGVQALCGAMVLAVDETRTVHAVCSAHGLLALRAKAVVLAMGCRERTRGAIGIPGTRPAGVFTAGAAQLYINIEGYQVGRRAVVLGSGDIGLIMARRLTLEGASVEGVYELMPYSSGLARNKAQCLDDYAIPLHLSHTITEIRGDTRVTGVTVHKVDEHRQPIPGTGRDIDCDTVLLSVGLLPENELSRKAGVAMDAHTGGPIVYENMETSLPGVFACGNVAHVHDLVDFVTAESMRAGAAAAAFAQKASSCSRPSRDTCEGTPCAPTESYTATNIGEQPGPDGSILVQPGAGIAYTLPQRIRPARVQQAVDISFRVRQVLPSATIEVLFEGEVLASCRRSWLAPGEMEHISLPAALLQKNADKLLKNDGDKSPKNACQKMPNNSLLIAVKKEEKAP